MNILTFIGCGGVFYHQINQLGNLIQYLDPARTKLIFCDPDELDLLNATRQYPLHAPTGQAKVTAAQELLQVCSHSKSIQQPASLELFEELSSELIPADLIWIFSSPDNHDAREVSWNIAKHLARTNKVIHITGGNSDIDGYAYSAYLYKDSTYNSLTRHPDIFETAQRERDAQENPESCQDLGEVDQTVWSNALTASLMCRAAFDFLMYYRVQDLMWVTEDATTKIYPRYITEVPHAN